MRESEAKANGFKSYAEQMAWIKQNRNRGPAPIPKGGKATGQRAGGRQTQVDPEVERLRQENEQYRAQLEEREVDMQHSTLADGFSKVAVEQGIISDKFAKYLFNEAITEMDDTTLQLLIDDPESMAAWQTDFITKTKASQPGYFKGATVAPGSTTGNGKAPATGNQGGGGGSGEKNIKDMSAEEFNEANRRNNWGLKPRPVPAR
jgi:hypothetical protein